MSQAKPSSLDNLYRAALEGATSAAASLTPILASGGERLKRQLLEAQQQKKTVKETLDRGVGLTSNKFRI